MGTNMNLDGLVREMLLEQLCCGQGALAPARGERSEELAHPDDHRTVT